jgi:hypothetical protein
MPARCVVRNFTKIHNSSDGAIHNLQTYTYHQTIHVPTSNIPSQNDLGKTLTEGGYCCFFNKLQS